MRKSETVVKTGPDGNTIRKALQSVFPSAASFSDFKENDGEISRRAIPAILHYAFCQGALPAETEKALLNILPLDSCKSTVQSGPDSFTFSFVLDTLTGRQSVNALITQLAPTARLLGLPSISAPMMTRLKQNFVVNTAKKRALLRLLAFWSSLKHPDLGWNYDVLSQLPAKTDDQTFALQDKAGVTINIHLMGQGEMISPPDILWLKNELLSCLDYLNLTGQVPKKMIEATGATSFSIRIPKKPGSPDEPALYAPGIRHALAVAHQMATRWLLCSQSSPRKRLILMIGAGLPSGIRRPDARLAENIPANDTGIYLDDFAHLCAEISNIKGFRRCILEQTERSAPRKDLWSLVYFWPAHFYDYIPCLLEERMLPVSNRGERYEQFSRELFFPETGAPATFGAIGAMHRHPQHSLHFIEIAKVLRARQMPHEADEILTHVLLTDPDNLSARFMRMASRIIFPASGLDAITTILFFERGIAEGEQLLKYYDTDNEIWWALGMLYFNRAIKTLQHLRRGSQSVDLHLEPDDVLACLRKSADCFRKGLATSSAGQTDNGLFGLLYAQSFIELFSGNKPFISDPHAVLREEDKNIFRQAGIRTMKNMGLLTADAQTQEKDNTVGDQSILKVATFIFSKNQNAVIGRSYIPYIQHVYAMILWDFTPRITTPTCKIVLYLLESARQNARRLEKDNLCVYQIFAGFVPAGRFVKNVELIIHRIRTFITDEELAGGDDVPIPPAKERKMAGVKLMLLEVDRP